MPSGSIRRTSVSPALVPFVFPVYVVCGPSQTRATRGPPSFAAFPVVWVGEREFVSGLLVCPGGGVRRFGRRAVSAFPFWQAPLTSTVPRPRHHPTVLYTPASGTQQIKRACRKLLNTRSGSHGTTQPGYSPSAATHRLARPFRHPRACMRSITAQGVRDSYASVWGGRRW